jgi:AcrR family transcriptional regulator
MSKTGKKPSKEAQKGTSNRFTREAWLIAALEVLSTSGNSSLRIARISSDLNVSKGSFYWHFENREAFLHAILDYWSAEYTQRVKAEARKAGGSARDQLRHVLDLVTRENLSRYDVAFDGWASHEPSIAEQVGKVYKIRWNYVRSLFAGMGFAGPELKFRTRAFLGFMKFQPNRSAAARRKITTEQIDQWLAFFTRK